MQMEAPGGARAIAWCWTPQTTSSCRAACDRGSAARHGRDAGAGRAGSGRAPESESFRRHTGPGLCRAAGKALTLGLDRYTASRVLYPIASLKDVGGLMRPATEWAMSDAELQKFSGFGKDMEKNRAEAKRLLAEAGYPNGFKAVLKNRNVRVPYVDFGVFVAQDRHRGRAPASRDGVLVRGWPGHRQLRADRQPLVQLHG